MHYSSAGSVKIITTTRPGDNSKYNLCIWSLVCLDCSTLQSIYKTTVQWMSYNYWQLQSSVLICAFGWTSLPPSFRTDVIMAAAASGVQTDRGVPLSTVSSSINLWLFQCTSDCDYMRCWQVESMYICLCWHARCTDTLTARADLAGVCSQFILFTSMWQFLTDKSSINGPTVASIRNLTRDSYLPENRYFDLVSPQ